MNILRTMTLLRFALIFAILAAVAFIAIGAGGPHGASVGVFVFVFTVAGIACLWCLVVYVIKRVAQRIKGHPW